jgi:hypothetical protein
MHLSFGKERIKEIIMGKTTNLLQKFNQQPNFQVS